MTTTLYKTSSIEKAQTAASLTNALAFRQLTLRNTRWGGRESVAERIIAGSLSRTIEGASTLQLTFDDPGFALLNSPLFDLQEDGRLDAIDILVDTLGFRVVKVEPTFNESTQNIAVTFEEREVALLRVHDSPIAVSRNAMTRAQFVRHKLVQEVKAEAIPMISPEEFEKQAIDQPKEWKATAKGQAPASGFDSGSKLKIEGAEIDADQKRNLEISLQVADVHKAPPLAYLAMLCAGIGESGFRAIPNAAGSGYAGVFQASPRNIPMKDTAQQAKYFLLGGKGFHGDNGHGAADVGAIGTAHAHPDWTPGHIAYVVEGSRANFASDALAEQHYESHHADAALIYKAWSGSSGSSGSTGTRTTVKQYQFTRGLPGKRETSWDAMQRLATEVGWRCYVVGGIVYFVSEEWLFMQQALTEIGPDTSGLLGIKGDWDEGKTEQQVTLTIDANRWEYPPGSIIALRGLGPCTGRWLVHTIDRQDIFDPTTEITLTKPLPRKHEPAATLITASRSRNAHPGGASSDPGNYGLPVESQYVRSTSDLGRTDDGVDIETAPDGSKVLSMTDGTVTAIASDPAGFGPNYPVIKVSGGSLAGQHIYYGHVARATVKVGDQVRIGDQIAVMGHTGDAASMNHGHIEVGFSNESGVPINQHGATAATAAGARMRGVLVAIIQGRK